ncbi:MAG: RNA pseudouridine synthase [Proteobacteria bacterium]|nr:RNA pseudouridine synthase [Pseudomonadota bacterium]
MAKPAGIPVFPPHDEPSGDCVLRRLLDEEPKRAALGFPDAFAGGIAHRLDISTSGALLVADSPEELVQLREAFAAKALTKTYRLLARKDVRWSRNHCEAELAHDRRRKKRMVVRRGQNTPHRGKWMPAETWFERLDGLLFQATMHTGVMHQIRLHAAYVGIPIVGDALYGGGPTPEGAPQGMTFYLHHVGLVGDGIQTTPVPLPEWAMVDTNTASEDA